VSEMADRFRTRYLENGTNDWQANGAGGRRHDEPATDAGAGSLGSSSADDWAADRADDSINDWATDRATDRASAPRVYAVPPSAHLEEVREEEAGSPSLLDDDPPARTGRHSVARTAPFWLTRPCPSWCQSDHTEADPPADRRHLSAPLGSVVLTETEAARSSDGGWQAQDVHITLTQHVREADPLISCGGHGPAGTWHLTVTEARELAAALTRAVDATRRY
jgi:hypothetical protein